MENKMLKVPFDLELAKKITSGEVEGRVITRVGQDARILCFDRKSDCDLPIIALVDREGKEEPESYMVNGMWNEVETDDFDLMLEVPEYLTFKDGDIITCGWKRDGEFCEWISIFKRRNDDRHIAYDEYVSYCINASKGEWFDLSFDDYTDSATWARKSTDEEIELFVSVLEKIDKPNVNGIIRKFFPNKINEKKEEQSKVWINGSLPKEDEEVIILVDVDGTILPHVVKFRERFNTFDGAFVFGSYPVIAYCKMPSYEEFKK